MLKLSQIIPFPDAPQEWEITRDCPLCEGYKVQEEVNTGVNSNGPYVFYDESKCDNCDDEGHITPYYLPKDSYDSIEDVQQDYPGSTVTLIPRRN